MFGFGFYSGICIMFVCQGFLGNKFKVVELFLIYCVGKNMNFGSIKEFFELSFYEWEVLIFGCFIGLLGNRDGNVVVLEIRVIKCKFFFVIMQVIYVDFGIFLSNDIILLDFFYEW